MSTAVLMTIFARPSTSAPFTSSRP
jgi:hypothetical protein